MTTIDTTNTLRNDVFSASRNQGKSTQAVIDAIKACHLDWSKPDQVDPIATAYKAGRISAALDCEESAALTFLSLKPFKDGQTADNRRTFGQHMACRAAISAWSPARQLPGTGCRKGWPPSTSGFPRLNCRWQLPIPKAPRAAFSPVRPNWA